MTPVDSAIPDISILIPIYNPGEYLVQCLDSLRDQSLDNLEFICINDGSTDDSLELMKRYAEKDSRIVIIDKPNSGYGASMNKGLACARGRYIGIVEPDDYVSLKMFAQLYKSAKAHDCDVVKANYYEHREEGDVIIRNFQGFRYKQPFDAIDKPEIVCTIPSIWSGIYKKSFLEEHGIRFRETPGASFQDAAFSLKVWFASKRCVLLRKPLLFYRVDNPNSSVKTKDKVFAVNEELAESEEFLRAMPERAKVFLPWFNVDKFGKYRWNYDRIADSEKVSFMQRMRDEYHKAQNNKELNLHLFKKEDHVVLEYLLEHGAEAFVKRYPESFFQQ
ncbi:MAG: glycosyltransferase [Raoultibacter sp.]|jgi:glycosyltransferase involved in cell wall biosynthesis